jgi:hypothetical protein
VTAPAIPPPEQDVGYQDPPLITLDKPAGGRVLDLVCMGGALCGFTHLALDGGQYASLVWFWLVIILVCLGTIGGRRSTAAIDAAARLARALRGMRETAEHSIDP